MTAAVMRAGCSPHAQALHAARRCELHKCGHDKGQCTPAACIREAIGETTNAHASPHVHVRFIDVHRVGRVPLRAKCGLA